MKRIQLAVATLVIMTASAVFAYVQTVPNPAPDSGQQQGQGKR
jgi:hypothetical protein